MIYFKIFDEFRFKMNIAVAIEFAEKTSFEETSESKIQLTTQSWVFCIPITIQIMHFIKHPKFYLRHHFPYFPSKLFVRADECASTGNVTSKCEVIMATGQQ